MIKLKTITDLHEVLGLKSNKHEFFSVNDLSKYSSKYHDNGEQFYYTEFFMIHLVQEQLDGELTVGKTKINLKPNQLSFSPPYRVVKFKPINIQIKRKGWGLYIHPNFLLNHKLGKQIFTYPFFSLNFLSSLEMNDDQLKIVENIFSMLKFEHDKPKDKFNEILFVKIIDMFLEFVHTLHSIGSNYHYTNDFYCLFSNKILDYLNSDLPLQFGLPNIKSISKELGISENTLRTKIKEISGLTPQKIINQYLSNISKYELMVKEKSISQISLNLGFSNQSAFTKFFKKYNGLTPLEFRNEN